MSAPRPRGLDTHRIEGNHQCCGDYGRDARDPRGTAGHEHKTAGLAQEGEVDTDWPRQGELQGAIGSMSGLVAILSPPFMTETFAFFSAGNAPVYFPGAPFFASAILTLLALVLLWRTVSAHDLARKVGAGNS